MAAEAPYSGEEFSMLIAVPAPGRFAEVRSGLAGSCSIASRRAHSRGAHRVVIPRWAGRARLDLLGWLGEIGAAPGHYPAIAPGAFLDAAAHGVELVVDERGTVAAAGTAFGFVESLPPRPELTVRADPPFLYLVRHHPSGLVLFASQVTDPSA